MKIGILTFHFAHNYGAMLQAYALSTKLRNMGYDAEIIDYRLEYIYKYTERVSFEKLYRQYVKSGDNSFKALLKVVKNFYYVNHKTDSWYRFEDFLDKTLVKSIRCSKNDFANMQYDYVICGSDQIWNGTLTGGLEPVYFGEGFSAQCKILTYAASNGHNEILDKDKPLFTKLIKNISNISVREKGLHDNLTAMGINNTCVLDPIFLLDKDEWKKIAIKPKESDYVLSYSFSESPNYFRKAEQLAAKLGKQLVCFTFRKKKDAPESAVHYFVGGPKEFLGYFCNASYIITNSFHGTAFSILFEKNFVCVPPLLRRERLDSVLQSFQIEGNVVEDGADLPEAIPSIKYDIVRSKLDSLRKESIGFIKSSLNS